MCAGGISGSIGIRGGIYWNAAALVLITAVGTQVEHFMCLDVANSTFSPNWAALIVVSIVITW